MFFYSIKRMANIFELLSVSDKVTVQDDYFGDHEARYLTLGNQNPKSGNRYYVSFMGQDAQIDWQVGDRIMVDLSLVAYKHQGQWHTSHRSDSIKFIEIDNINKEKYV